MRSTRDLRCAVFLGLLIMCRGLSVHRLQIQIHCTGITNQGGLNFSHLLLKLHLHLRYRLVILYLLTVRLLH
uniref:Threonine synthase n=1 Tax=Arundo donax TaxID=35708 RepID=A0A0A9DGF1_ARUDO